MNEELNKAFEQISDEHINEAASYHKPRFPWLRSIAALLALIVAWTAVWAAFDFPSVIIYPANTTPTESFIQEPTPNSNASTSTPPDISTSQPANYFCFESIDEIKGLFSATTLNDQEFEQYVHGMTFHPYTDVSVLRQSTDNLKYFLSTVQMPYHNGAFHMYYYFANDIVELFMDVDGIRYQFLINSTPKDFTGELAATGVSIDGNAFDLHLQNDQLKGEFSHNGRNIRVIVFTNDPGKVNFSAFSLQTYAADF